MYKRYVILPKVIKLPKKSELNSSLILEYNFELEKYKNNYDNLFKKIVDKNKLFLSLSKILISELNAVRSTKGTEEIDYLNVTIEEIEELLEWDSKKSLTTSSKESIVRSRLVRSYNSFKFNPKWTAKRSLAEFKKLHSLIFKGILAKPGVFKTSNNAVSSKAKVFSSVEEVSNKIEIFFDKLENLTNDQKLLPAHVGILHAFLYGIHPFQDGNERIIKLWMDKVLSSKVGIPLFLSESLFNNNSSYHRILNSYHFDWDYIDVGNEFMKLVIYQLKLNNGLLKDIKEDIDYFVKQTTSFIDSKNLYPLAFILATKSIVNSEILVKRLLVSNSTAKKIIDSLLNADLLTKYHHQLLKWDVYYVNKMNF